MKGCQQKTSVINLSGQRLEDKLRNDGFPSFSAENRSTGLNVSELLTWMKRSYCLNKSPALSCRCFIRRGDNNILLCFATFWITPWKTMRQIELLSEEMIKDECMKSTPAINKTFYLWYSSDVLYGKANLQCHALHLINCKWLIHVRHVCI